MSPDEKPRFLPMHTEYWALLGRFIETFAHVEGELFNYFCEYAGIEGRVGRAVFAGARVEILSSNLRRLWIVKPPEPGLKKELDGVLGQLKLITGVRNSITHYPSYVVATSGDPNPKRISANTTRAISPQAHTVHYITSEMMEHLCFDLTKILEHLWSVGGFPDGHTAPFDERARAFSSLRASWRYKAPPNPNQKPRKAKPPKGKKGGRNAPPQASGE